MTRHQIAKIREFVTFITHVYLHWELHCKEAADSPWNEVPLEARQALTEALLKMEPASLLQSPLIRFSSGWESHSSLRQLVYQHSCVILLTQNRGS
jgi:hypothetical protein